MRLTMSWMRHGGRGSNGSAASSGSNSSGGNGTSALIPPGNQGRRRPPRLWLSLLLGFLALAGLLLNLFLLLFSVDQFLLLLRQHCAGDSGRTNDGKSAAAADREGQPRLRIGAEQARPVFSFRPPPSHPREEEAEEEKEEKSAENSRQTADADGNNGKTTTASSKLTTMTTSSTTESSPKTTTTSATPAIHRTRLTSQRLTIVGGAALGDQRIRPGNKAEPRVRVTATDLMRGPQILLATTTSLPPGNHQQRQRQHRHHLPTVVTALLDIGRERWVQYGRTLSQYHRYMSFLLQLRVPMVVFVDDKSAEFVHRERARIGWGSHTKVRHIALSELPLFAFQAQVERIMRFELANWPSGWDPAMRNHPEASHPEYVLLVNSKPFFLAEAATENPFGSDSFVWLDAGYGHGNRAVFPPNWRWQPRFSADKISLIKLTPPTDPIDRYDLDQLYRQDVSVFSGGFVAGNAAAIHRLHQLHQAKFIELLTRRHRVDDDQTLLVLLANEHPDLFQIAHSFRWFSAFELFR